MADHARDRRTYRVSTPRELQVLISPARLELLGLFEGMRVLSVRDMAGELGKPVASLYFHVHKLAHAGLLVERGRRGDGREAETLSGATAERIELPLTPAKASRAAATKTLRALLRQAEREFGAAVQREKFRKETVGSGSASGRRQRAWLTMHELQHVAQMLERIESYLSKRSKKRHGVPVSWSSVLVPLEVKP
jgi:predicted transcriptional regulator